MASRMRRAMDSRLTNDELEDATMCFTSGCVDARRFRRASWSITTVSRARGSRTAPKRTQEEFIGALPPVAIIPFFFAGSFFSIAALPAWPIIWA